MPLALKFSHQISNGVKDVTAYYSTVEIKRANKNMLNTMRKNTQLEDKTWMTSAFQSGILSDPCYDIIFHVSGQMLSNSWIPSLIWNKMLRARAI